MTQIFGQDRALEILQSALNSGRFHHGWIFSGPRGVGKFTTALEVARALLDPEAPRQLPVGRVDSRDQQLIDAGTHPDLHIIRKELAKFSGNRELRDRKQLNIPIDLLRERVIGGKVGEHMHDAAAYRTAQRGHGKVFIIDEAELLDGYGQNAMLKTLEEPPTDTYFFLITSQPDRLLATIRSRCQHVRFQPLDEQAMRQWLKHYIATQPKSADDDEEAAFELPRDVATIEWALEFAEGSPGDALLALEYSLYTWQKTLGPMIEDLERGKFPAGMGEAMSKLIEDFVTSWIKNHGEKTTSKDAANKDGARRMLALLASHARRQLAASVGRHSPNDPAALPYLKVIDLLREAERQLDSNVNYKLLLENLAVQWGQAMAMNAAA